MTEALADFVVAALAKPVRPEIAALASRLAERLGGKAVLFYGSNLRTGSLEGVLDFYVLAGAASGNRLRRLGTWLLWPDVSYHEELIGGVTLRAKVATMPLARFERAAAGQYIDTTIWARFVQPSTLIWHGSEQAATRVRKAVANCAITAGRFAAALGPIEGSAADHWAGLFRETYDAEFRVEAPGRERSILAFDAKRYDDLLPLAWAGGGVGFEQNGPLLRSRLATVDCARLIGDWVLRARLGKLLNIARLIKAAFTFDGAARYGLWKIERHTGIAIPLTPWREHHPILAAPGVLMRLLRARAA